MFKRTRSLRQGVKIRVTAGPAKGKTGRIQTALGGGDYVVHLHGATSFAILSAAQMEVA